MITSLRDFQAAPGVSREASKEDFWVALHKAGSIKCSESKDDSALRKLGRWQAADGDTMVLSMALMMTGLLQVQIRPSSPASSSKACIGWEKAEQTGSEPHEIITKLGPAVSRLQVG